MCKLGFTAIMMVFLIGSTCRSWGSGDDEKLAARAIMEKAIKAHGGEENLGKNQGHLPQRHGHCPFRRRTSNSTASGT